MIALRREGIRAYPTLLCFTLFGTRRDVLDRRAIRYPSYIELFFIFFLLYWLIYQSMLRCSTIFMYVIVHIALYDIWYVARQAEALGGEGRCGVRSHERKVSRYRGVYSTDQGRSMRI